MWLSKFMKKDLQTPEEYVAKYPNLTAHLICESLGYFTVTTAGRALLAYKQNEPLACEWYSHMSSCRGKGMFDDNELRRINKDVISAATTTRHNHKGYMSDYKYAKALVDKFNDTGYQPGLASWF
jgi:hypothetical protein